MFRWPWRDYFKGTCTNSFCEKWHPPECLFYKTKSGCRFGEKCSYAHRQVDEQPGERSKTNGDKRTVAVLKITQTIGLRIPRYGAAEIVVNLTEELRHAETNPTCKIHESRCTSPLKFETKILRSEWFVQVNLISAAPTLQNLRIGLRRRQSGKSKVPMKQRGSWPKVFQN